MSAGQYRHTCDELGVCQDRPIACFGCKPSEGTTSARQILRTVPIAGRDCVDTGRVVIGRAHIPQSPLVISRDAETVQTALLEPRTARPASAVARVAGALWRLA